MKKIVIAALALTLLGACANNGKYVSNDSANSGMSSGARMESHAERK
jgi:hypothetical protein